MGVSVRLSEVSGLVPKGYATPELDGKMFWGELREGSKGRKYGDRYVGMGCGLWLRTAEGRRQSQ